MAKRRDHLWASDKPSWETLFRESPKETRLQKTDPGKELLNFLEK
jgi:hypothetical protein